MSKFRRVSETENLPSFMEKKFVGASVEIDEDPYAELRKNSAENRVKISKQEIGTKKVVESMNKSWEKISGASVYDDLRPKSYEERLASLDFGSIRRSDYAYDEGDNTRTTTSGLKAFSQDDYLNAMLSRSASIFNPDMIDISSEFLNSQESTSAQAMLDQAQKREARSSKHNAWEEKKLNSIRESSVVNTRAHSILRTSSDAEHTSQFGMLDPDRLDERESLRVANQEKIRSQRLAVRKNIQENIVNNSQQRPKTLREIYNSIDLDFED